MGDTSPPFGGKNSRREGEVEKRIEDGAHIWGVQEAKSRRKERCKGMVEEMKKYRSEMERMIQDLREKEDRQVT
jgi:hypothetical protein